MQTQKVGVVVLNWNNGHDTVECIKSVNLLTHENKQIYVVDNDSTDDSVAHIAAQFPKLRIYQTGANLGWSGGNNFGITEALKDNCDYIYLLNNDAEVFPDGLTRLLELAEQSQSYGFVGGKIIGFSDPNYIEFCGSFEAPPTNLPESYGGYAIDLPHFSAPTVVPFISGCSILVSAAVCNAIGLIDNKFFLNYDETDWCYRGRNAGYLSIFLPEVICRHKRAISFGGVDSPLRIYFCQRNRLLFAARHFTWPKLLMVFRSLLWEMEKLRVSHGYTSRLSLLYHYREPRVYAFFRGVADFFFGNFGDCPSYIRIINKSWQEK